MSTTQNLPAVPEVSLVPVTATVSERPSDPYRAYLNHFDSPASGRTMAACLDRIARIRMLLEHFSASVELDADGLRYVAEELQAPTPGGEGAFQPWWLLRRERTIQIRAVLASTELGWAPAYVNKHLSALRGVLEECWNQRLIPTDDYLRARKLKNVKGERTLAGRSIHPDEMAALLDPEAGTRVPLLRVTVREALYAVLAEHGPMVRLDALAAAREALGRDCSGSTLDVAFAWLVDTGAARRTAKRGEWVATGKPPAKRDTTTALRARDEAMLVVMECTGIRAAEVAQARIERYDSRERCLKVIGKGNKERPVWIHKDAVPYLDRWLAMIGEREGPIFRTVDRWGNIHSSGISVNVVGQTVKRRRLAAGLPPLSPHDFRRTQIGELYDAGGDSQQARKIAGHTKSETTDGYDRRGDRGLRDLIDRLPIVLPPAPEARE
jgi:integrase